jgi:hypothetical protein
VIAFVNFILVIISVLNKFANCVCVLISINKCFLGCRDNSIHVHEVSVRASHILNVVAEQEATAGIAIGKFHFQKVTRAPNYAQNGCIHAKPLKITPKNIQKGVRKAPKSFHLVVK